MTFDQSTLYNKFHIISIGLRKIDKLLSHSNIEKAKVIIEQITRTSDEGMEYIKETDLGWIGG